MIASGLCASNSKMSYLKKKTQECVCTSVFLIRCIKLNVPTPITCINIMDLCIIKLCASWLFSSHNC